jgi:UDP-N-acetylglucosamine--N-acetylmuramyl-(pentapeptide) pyrophosphoryl-undecaprenol N-acetylglucosamine transferase
MGGFVAGPGGLMAKVLHIPLIIHEQNRIPGTTNRSLAKFADVILEAFPDSFGKKFSAICTGNPLRKGFARLIQKSEEKQSSELHLLVVGGSQGAKILNEIVPEAAACLPAIEIVHQTGSLMHEQVNEHYSKLELKANVVAFIENMVEAYQWADLVVCRSGAMTVSELAAAGLPSILVPYPYAIDDHQTANARYLCDANAGLMISEDLLTVELLADLINRVSNNLKAMSAATQQCARLDATAKVADICIARAG